MNGIGSAEIRPAMPTGSRHLNAKSAAAHCLIQDALAAGAVNCNELAVSVAPRSCLEEMPDTSKIAFPFFANIGNTQDRPAKSYACFLCSAEQPEQRNE